MIDFKTGALIVALAAAPLAAHASSVNFTDTFTGGASSHWQSYTGSWAAHDGVYDAQYPNNNPLTLSSLDFNLQNASSFTFDVDVNSLADGGIWIDTDGTNQNGVLLVLGGSGYGPSNGAAGGHDIYWHIVQGGSVSGQLGLVGGVFTPGQDYHLTVTASGGVYNAYVNGVFETSITNNIFSQGQVGLYDEWGPMTFDNVHLVGVDDAVPEPATWAMMILGMGGVGATMRRRSVALA